MAPDFGLVKDIDRNNKKALKVRVVRMFSKGGYEKNGQNNSIEIVLHDKEGGRITCVIKKINVGLFEDRLIEGRVYGVRNYYVENNTGKYRTTLAQFRIVFHAKTLLIPVSEESFFPDFMFDFRDFATLVNPDKIDETLLFDVIGKVCEIHNPEEKDLKGRRVRLIEMVLEDLRGRRISCTLWGPFVDQILSFESGLSAEPAVLILQMCRAKVYRDKVTLSNSFDVTQIHTYDGIPAIQKFISKLPKEVGDGAKSVSRGSLTLSRLEKDDLATGQVICHPVDHVYTVDEPSSFWICAIISSFIDDWWYLACTKCHRKLRENNEKYDCVGCNKSYTSGIFRYMLRLEVLDSTANASVLLWNREAEKLIGRSCHDLRVEFLENRSEFEDIPDDVAKLIDQTVLFKVNVKDGQIHNESSTFLATRIVTDSTLVQMYNKWTLEDDNESDFLTLMQRESDNEMHQNSDDEVTTPVKKVQTVQIDGENSSIKKLVFDEGMDSNSMKKSRVLSKNGQAVRKTTKDVEDVSYIADEEDSVARNGRAIEDEE